MGVALIGWGRFLQPDGSRSTVPCPSSTPSGPWLWDFLASQAPALSQVGFTALQIPPVAKGWGGTCDGCDGYGVFDPRDLGTKAQQGSTPTRYGNAESLRRMVACCHSEGIDVYVDIVLHQLDGENGGAGVFNYLGADGQTLSGRGPMQPGCFRGLPPNNCPQDPVPSPRDDAQDGREKVYLNCAPPGYTTSDALDYGDWLFRTTDADGMRCDDVKGIWPSFLSQFLTSNAMATRYAFSEFFDGNPANLNNWVVNPPISSRSLVIDFPLHFALVTACNTGNAQVLNDAGYAAWNPYLACTFVDNPDSDTTPGQAVVNSKLLAYAFILSIEGYPFVYGKDYFPSSVWPGAYGLKPWIDQLVWIHENLASGETVTRWVDPSVIVIERLGSPGLLTALSFDSYNARPVTCATRFGPNVTLHDYAGHHPDIVTDGSSQATFTIPTNTNQDGQSYLCFSAVGIASSSQPAARATTQTFFGAWDLDIPPAMNGSAAVGRVWCAGKSVITVSMALENPLTEGQTIGVDILDPKGQSLGALNDPLGSLQVKAKGGGWHTLSLAGSGLPSQGVPFQLTVAYTAAEAPLGS